MDYQILFNIAVGLAGVFGGWILNHTYAAIDRLENDLRHIPHEYVTKDDYKSELRKIDISLNRIFDKLDEKADKE